MRREEGQQERERRRRPREEPGAKRAREQVRIERHGRQREHEDTQPKWLDYMGDRESGGMEEKLRAGEV